MQFNFPSLKKDFPIHIYFADETTGAEPREVIIYVRNRAWERIGQEGDLSILKDYIERKFIVMTLDFGEEPNAVSPLIDDDINRVYRAAFGYQTPSVLRAVKLEPKAARCFILPEGYRVATDLTYWEIDKHGVYGTLEYIMKTYNEEIVPKVPGMKPARKPSDMVDRNGKPFDYRIQMDIVYPSQAKRKCPAFVYSDTEAGRDTHHRYLFQMRGYVYVVMGHCFNPCVLHYGDIGPFTLDHWNGLACYTAAMRYLCKYADQYSINTDHIGMMGLSKGQYAVTRLSDPNNALTREAHTFNEIEGLGKFPDGTYGPQPWQGYPFANPVRLAGNGRGPVVRAVRHTRLRAHHPGVRGERPRRHHEGRHPSFPQGTGEVGRQPRLPLHGGTGAFALRRIRQEAGRGPLPARERFLRPISQGRG